VCFTRRAQQVHFHANRICEVIHFSSLCLLQSADQVAVVFSAPPHPGASRDPDVNSGGFDCHTIGYKFTNFSDTLLVGFCASTTTQHMTIDRANRQIRDIRQIDFTRIAIGLLTNSDISGQLMAQLGSNRASVATSAIG
jgi:hypothetical protein